MRIIIYEKNNKKILLKTNKDINDGSFVDNISQLKHNIINLDDKYFDCKECDFNEDLTFNPVKYSTRKTIELSKQKIEELEKKLKDYDYIGVKIATGRGTIEEYKNQIAEMTDWANQINSLKNYLKTLD